MSASRPKVLKSRYGPSAAAATPATPPSSIPAGPSSKPNYATKVLKQVTVVPKPPSLQNGKTRVKESSRPTSRVGSDSRVIVEVPDSDSDEDDFEEVPIPATAPARYNASAGPSSPFPATPTTATNRTAATTPGTMTADDTDDNPYGEDSGDESEEDAGVIRLEIGGETPEEKAKRIALAMRKKPMTSKDRALRIEVHKIHVIALLASMRIRNCWASNLLLKARLLSLTPHPLVAAFSIPPSRFPDRAQRSRLFYEALQSLVSWWCQTYFDIDSSTVGLRTRPWDEVQAVIDKLPRLTRADLSPLGAVVQSKKKGKEKEKEEDERLEKYEDGAGSERLRTAKSLMKRVLRQYGSRDVSAILFVALCRACGLGTRLVASIQAVPWRAEKVVVKKMSGAGKGGRSLASRQGIGPGADDSDSMEEVPIPGEEEEAPDENGEGGPGQVMEKIKRPKIRAAGRRRQQDPAEVYRLRKPKPAPQTLAGKPKPKTKLDLSTQPPVIWAEVFCRSDQKWVSVDPTRGTMRKKGMFEPATDNGPVRTSYVVAFEEDGYARDVTLRYTRSFGAKTAKLRAPPKKDEPDWWEGVLGFLARPYRLNRDDLEDAELETSQTSEAMPLHMSGFKDHPLFVLERHLKREEVILPKREAGKFRGEPVYRRQNVLSCKTAENWMRVGRRVKEGQQALKWVKQRAMTLNKRREVELAKQNGEEQMQGLYAEYQTQIYKPPPIKNGIIPQNAFGNIDLYAPTMLPDGARHLPYKGIAKIAKQLGISYAEACTGFEFKKQRAIPVITGIVVPEEEAETVLDAYWESNAAAEERERQKRVDKALKRWAKLVNAVRVRERLQATYGDKDGMDGLGHNPLADPEDRAKAKPSARSATSVLNSTNQAGNAAWLDRTREMSSSPTPELGDDAPSSVAAVNGTRTDEVDLQLPPIGVKTEPGDDEDDDDDDLEEVDTGGNAVAERSAKRDSTPLNDGSVELDAKEEDQMEALATPPRRDVGRRGKVDNPYEESDEDEVDLPDQTTTGGSNSNGSKGGGQKEEEETAEAAAEVDEEEQEDVVVEGEEEEEEEEEHEYHRELEEVVREITPPTTRSGRKVKLRVGRIVEAPDRAEKRVTRSSKRKR